MTARAPGTQYLCICADDFGMSRGINAAVLDLIERRKLTATGCLVQREAWGLGLLSLRRVEPERADVGLHLDLTPPRVPGGDEPGLGALLLRTYTRSASRRGLQHVIADQLSRFEDGMGRPPAFVDGHRHVHQFPVVRRALLDELSSRYGAALPWLRDTRPRMAQGSGALKAHVIHALGGRALAREAARRSAPMSQALLGVYDFAGDAAGYRRRMLGWLAAARSGDVLMCHPSLDGTPATPHGEARIAEYTVLATMDFPWTSPTGDSVALAPWSRHARRAQA
ncbi:MULTISPECIES: ChbG/HpnK family deacetylase [unclassified Variovorax]|uniref:ChbG/HpnK family deacetylase n=1 Tax=unclassified Variovorax TaxID=663243 RepID=UPI003F4866E1